MIPIVSKSLLCFSILALLCFYVPESNAARGRSYSRPTTVRPYQRAPKIAQAPRQLAPKPVYPKGARGTASQPDLTKPLPKHKQLPNRVVKDSAPQAGVHQRVVTHPSGRRDIYQSKTREANGDIGKKHSHVVLNKARQVEVAKTMDRKTLKDSGRHIPKR